MANNKPFKIKNGLSAKVYLQSSSALSASDVDVSSGSYFSKTLTANTTLTFSNPPASGVGSSFALEITGAAVTVGYDIANAAYDSKSFSVSSQEANPRSTTFKPDGTKMYVVGNNNNTVYQYSLSTSFDASTASYDTISSNISTNSGPYSYSLTFNPDGTKMYTIGQLQSSPYDYRIYQYTLSTAWDLSTTTYDTLFAFAYGTYGVSTGFCFNNNGTKFYLTSNTGDSILQWSLSTAYDVSTASYDSVTFSVAGQTTTPSSIAINTSGTKIIVLGANDNALFEYDLSTAFSLSTASYNNVSLSVSSPTAATKSNMVFNPDGSKMYLTASGVIYQWTTAASTPATVSYPSSVKWSGATAPDAPASGEKDVYVFITTDGGSNYYGKQAGDAVA
tara:strand:+ start:2047 stop:3219 length:1173 start_codon:yes stop_codon:yes gene_type:complete